MQIRSILTILEANRELLSEFHIRSLSVFGFVARGEATTGSDVDLLVEFEPTPVSASSPLRAFSGLFRSFSVSRSIL